MPIYEYFSPKTRKIYSFFARSLAYASKVPRCPDDPAAPMEKLVSQFSVTGRAKEKPEGGGEGEEDPRMERAMAEMEREFGGMDESNPDPRQLARMMRKMSSLTGEPMPAQMEEMIGRMEKGEDPEKLEAEYGDALEGMDGPGEGDADEPAGMESGYSGLKRRLRRRQVQRDPTLYEMAEYVD